MIDLENKIFRINDKEYEVIEYVEHNNKVYVYLVNRDNELDSSFYELINNNNDYYLDEIDKDLFQNELLKKFTDKLTIDLKYENMYKEQFEKYLLSKVNLVEYDNSITNSNLDFGLCNNYKLPSNLDEFLNLKYIYILNKFYIEKLSKEELNILVNGNEQDKEQLINNTYKKILLYGDDPNKKVKINYNNTDIYEDYSNNDELVIGIFYGSNNNKYNTEEDYLDNYNKKKEFMKELSQRLKEEIKLKLDLNTNVIIRKK